MADHDVVIVSAVRTAVGNFGGVLKDVSATQLGTTVMKGVLAKVGLRPKTSEETLKMTPKLLDQTITAVEKKHYDWDEKLKPVQVDEVIMGQVLPAGLGQNPVRQAMIFAGIPKETVAYQVNHLCASGLKAIMLGADSIRSGQSHVVIAGGMESMSGVPYSLPKARFGYRMDLNGQGELHDLMVHDGLWESFHNVHMGVTAENIAAKYSITREDQDKLAVLSNERARKAIADGTFKQEIVPVAIAQRRGPPTIVEVDEKPIDTNLQKMAALRPVFKEDGTGTVTAGNASGINDAAACVLMMTRKKAAELGLTPMATFLAGATAGVDPAYMGLGVIPATNKVLSMTGKTIADIEVAELNEAFAAQALACVRELGMKQEIVNTHGSGISIGHPIGCSGARIVVTLLHEMVRANKKLGLASLCVGGGQGIAALFTR